MTKDQLSINDIDWENFQATQAVLCFLSRPARQQDSPQDKVASSSASASTSKQLCPNEEILLIERLSDYGRGLISAPGGKLDPGESLQQCVIRECEEEVGLSPFHFEMRAELLFHFTSGKHMHGYAYFGSDWTGELRPSAEARPFWCPKERLPLHSMWQDDPIWLPYVLDGGKIKGYFIFNDELELLNYHIDWLR